MAGGGTALTYNGVTLGNCQTLAFEQQSVYDQSDTDYLYTRFRVRVQGYFLGFTSTDGPRTVPQHTSSATAQLTGLRHALSEPRKAFRLVYGATITGTGAPTGGVVALSATPALGQRVNLPADTDLNNGPKPRALNVTHVAGDNALRVEYEIEVCISTCPTGRATAGASAVGSAIGGALGGGVGGAISGSLAAARGLPVGGGNLDPVISNKWAAADTIDKNWYTTRTYRGQLRLKSAIQNAHEFRGVVIPPLSLGMRRESMEFTTSKDGLTLDYTITDREVTWAAPAPATNWDYQHTEQMSGDFGLTVHSSCQVMLEGDRNVDKKVLISLGASIIDGILLLTRFLAGNVPKINFQDEDDVRRNDGRAILTHYQVTVEGGSNQVNRVRLSAAMRRIIVDRDRIERMSAGVGEPITDKIIPPLPENNNIAYNPDRSRGLRPGETLALEGPISAAGLFASHLQSACFQSDRHDMCDGLTPLGYRAPACQVFFSVSPRTADETATLADQTFSDEHNKGPYTAYDMDNRIHVDHKIMQLPIARDTSEDTSIDFPSDSEDPRIRRPGENSVFVQLAPAQTRRTVRFRVERIGAPPELPEPRKFLTDRHGNKMVLLSVTVIPQEPTRNFDNQYLYKVDAEYVYGLSGEIGSVDFGTPAYEKRDLPERSEIGIADIFKLNPKKHTANVRMGGSYTPPDMNEAIQ